MLQVFGDEYTEYLTKNEYEDLMVSVLGNYVGIGIYMAQTTDGNIIILFPIEGSPAEEAGLQPGDIIAKINGEDCSDMTIDKASNKIKGEEGTEVELEILRDEETIIKKVTRRKIEIKYIDSSVINTNIGYIKLISFDQGSAEAFKEHLNALKEKNIKSLIIDLRDNGGGIVEEAISIAELFIPRGNIIMKSYDKDNKESVIKSSNVNPKTMKIVVLINENSASASEIFTAAIKDNNIGKIVGKTTFGKGVMQEVIEMKSGGALKITIEEFMTPNGDKINKEGIKPDIEIDEDEYNEKDIQLEEAIKLLK